MFDPYPHPVYCVKKDGNVWHAMLLNPEEKDPHELKLGLDSPGDVIDYCEEQYPNAVRLGGIFFLQEVALRKLHTPEMIQVLKNSYMGDLSACYVYGAPMRPMSGSWARIPDAVFINADKTVSGYHTYVVVPGILDDEMVAHYELAFVSRPE